MKNIAEQGLHILTNSVKFFKTDKKERKKGYNKIRPSKVKKNSKFTLTRETLKQQISQRHDRGGVGGMVLAHFHK